MLMSTYEKPLGEVESGCGGCKPEEKSIKDGQLNSNTLYHLGDYKVKLAINSNIHVLRLAAIEDLG
jgi:hypothetical protein